MYVGQIDNLHKTERHFPNKEEKPLLINNHHLTSQGKGKNSHSHHCGFDLEELLHMSSINIDNCTMCLTKANKQQNIQNKTLCYFWLCSHQFESQEHR